MAKKRLHGFDLVNGLRGFRGFLGRVRTKVEKPRAERRQQSQHRERDQELDQGETL